MDNKDNNMNDKSDNSDNSDKSKISDKSKKSNQEKKSNKPRCYHCNKKLKMMQFTCKCNHTFCVIHQNPHSHNCSFNNKKICQEAIKLNNPQTIHQKVVKI